MAPEKVRLEVAIIGGGISGLGVAFHLLRTAERLCRDITVDIFDKNSGPGGTWSRDSVYEGLMTNNSWKQMLFDDDGAGEAIFKSDASVGAGPGGFRATGRGMIRVMDDVERQVLEMGAVIHYETEVTNIKRSDSGGWLVERRPVDAPLIKSSTFDKIVVATGAFSRPAVPACALPVLQPFRQAIPDDKKSSPLVIHTSHLSDPSVQDALLAAKRQMVVVGASKSALDASERFSTLGHNVTLVLRNPPYLAPAAITTPRGPADAVAMVGSREKLIAVPYPADVVSGAFASGGLWAKFRRWVVHSSWYSNIAHTRLITRSIAGYSRWGQWSHPSLAPMIPKIGLMWSESSIFPGPEQFAHLVQSDKIRVQKGAVVNMQRSTVDGEDGYELSIKGDNGIETRTFATAVIFGSGWSTGEYPFFDEGERDRLGLPIAYTDSLPEREKEFEALDRMSLSSILSSIRTLRDMPKEWDLPGFSARFSTATPLKYAPYRLYRLMVPLDSLYDRDIAFAGIPTCKANHVLFICQAHWIADYFFELLPNLPSREVARKEISTQTVWAQRLFGPSHGRLGQWLGAMWIEYCSRLCWDMGVRDDGMGWSGVVISKSYGLEGKRAARDASRGIH